ncbi:MAG: hypothetical protein ABL997_09290 [Planctomycetota bacterium]
MSILVRTFSICIVQAIAVAQTTWVVDRFNRPGAQFTDLPAAVAAAASGDVILLRATSASRADSYLAPAIQGKGLTIVGETGIGLPEVVVTGSWTIQAVPTGSTLVISSMRVGVASSIDFPPQGRPFAMQITDCIGAVVLRRIVAAEFDPVAIPAPRDNALMIFSECSMELGYASLRFLRCKVMMNNSGLSRARALFGSPAATVILDSSELHLAGCVIDGASPTIGVQPSSPAVEFVTGGKLFVNEGCRLVGGLQRTGFRSPWVHFQPAQPADCIRAEVEYDPAATVVQGTNPLACMRVTMTPQSGLRTSTQFNILHIDHDTTPNAPAILLMAPLQATPWNTFLGPIFLDQNFVWASLGVAPTFRPLRRSFVIPPTIPSGQWVGVQAFELDTQNNTLLATNVTVVGVL